MTAHRHIPAIRQRVGFRGEQVYSFYLAFTAEHGFAPSYATIGDVLGMDKASVCKVVKRLEKRALVMRAGPGRIRRGRGDTRGTVVLA